MRPVINEELKRYSQANEYDCGRSCVGAASWLAGRTRREAIRAASLVVPNEVDGTPGNSIDLAFKAVGLKTLAGRMELGDLEHFTKTGRPVVCLINSSVGGHWVVVHAVGDWVSYWCPAAGGALYRAPIGWFLAKWHDANYFGVAWSGWGVVAW